MILLMTDGMEALSLRSKSRNKLQICQRMVKRFMLGVILREERIVLVNHVARLTI